jgi:hypothetical protein
LVKNMKERDRFEDLDVVGKKEVEWGGAEWMHLAQNQWQVP